MSNDMARDPRSYSDISPNLRVYKNSIECASLPIIALITYMGNQMRTAIFTGENIYTSEMSDAKYGQPQGELLLEDIKHELCHILGARARDSLFGKLIFKYWNLSNLSSHDYLSEVFAITIQNYFNSEIVAGIGPKKKVKDQIMSSDNTEKLVEENAKYLAVRVILYKWLRENVTESEKQELIEWQNKSAMELDYKLKINPDQDLKIVTPKLNWLERLQKSKFKKPTNSEFREFLELKQNKLYFTGLVKCTQTEFNQITKRTKTKIDEIFNL